MNLSGCIAKPQISINLFDKTKTSTTISVAQVQVLNDQLIINGINLSGVTEVKLVKGGVTQTFSVESVSASQIVANGISTFSVGVGNVFDLILSSATAAVTVPVSFTLSNKSITGAMIANMGAQSGDVLTFNGTDWDAASPANPQLYKGTWDPTIAGSIPLAATAGSGSFYVVSKSGTYAGNGVAYDAGDWILEDAGSWVKIPMSTNSVASYNGRKGVVVPEPADYVLLKNGSGKLPGSSLNDLANVDLTGLLTGDVLTYDGAKWVPAAVSGGGGGGSNSVGSTEITDLSITGADIAENTIPLSKLSPATSNAALYLRGDKTWATFATDVLDVQLSTYSLSAAPKPAVVGTDKIGVALGKVQKFLNDLNTDYISKSASSQVVSGTFSFTTPASFLYTQTPTGVSATEVTNVEYVQRYVDINVGSFNGYAPLAATTVSGSHNAGATTLTVVSTADYPPSGTLNIGGELITYTGKTGTTFTGLTRGAFGTASLTELNGLPVDNYLFLARTTTTSAPKMVVNNYGDVGIGVISPTATLHVKGSIVSESASSATAYIDFSKGNVQINSTGLTTINLCGLKDGGSYTLVLTGVAANSTVTVNAYPTYVNATTCSGTAMAVDLSGGEATFTSSGNTNILSFVYFSGRGANGTVYGFPATNYQL